MRTLIFDPSYGCSGDMILGALVDAGVSIDELKMALAGIALDGFDVSSENTERNQIASTRVIVSVDETTAHRHLADIYEIIDASRLPRSVIENSKSIFARLAEAEAAVHGTSVDSVHFHEVGAVDAIVDIVGACIGIELLNVDRILSRPIAIGSGTIECDHGMFPVPAPATSNLIKGFPVRMYTIAAELTTPTGAAIVTTLAEPLVDPLNGRMLSVGYGAGTRSFENHPNLMRLFLFEEGDNLDADEVVEMRTNIDDMSPEVYSHLFDRLNSAGALDVYVTPVVMKKNRPGHELTVLCDPNKQTEVRDMIFAETTTSGLRISNVSRVKLPRRSEVLSTPLGECEIKVFDAGGRVRKVPEYESVKKIADRNAMTYLEAYDSIIAHLKNSEKE